MKFTVHQNSVTTATSKAGSPYRKQRVMAHCEDGSVLPVEFMLNAQDMPLAEGDYQLSPSSITVRGVPRQANGRTYVENRVVIDFGPQALERITAPRAVKAA